MFLKSLRDLHITKKETTVELNYKCKQCNCPVTVNVTYEQYEDLKAGLPFSAVFTARLRYFKQGKCELCLTN